ncbi:MAG: class I tRNA ligase family protein, partial [Endomicrobia bacterium]|nr:class I tRNA ligase family protein [Endomicrobiia bacterium]
NIEKFPSYGKLSKKKIDELRKGARIEPDETKKSPIDFALWKITKHNDFISWDSPWGKGRPGWHIECSVMSTKYLGETLDIHGGGIDLVFPHHENEIAQSESLTGKPFVKYWVHNGFVTINQQKMSKSLKNIFALKDIFQIYNPMITRLFLISQHYQKPLDFSLQEIEQFKATYQKFLNLSEEINLLEGRFKNKKNFSISEQVKSTIEKYIQEFENSMDNNLNTSSAIAVIHKISSFIYKLPKDNPADILYSYEKFLTLLEDVLGIKISLQDEEIPQEVQKLLLERENARKNKDYKTADEIRIKIFNLGYMVEDTIYGPRLKKRF